MNDIVVKIWHPNIDQAIPQRAEMLGVIVAL